MISSMFQAMALAFIITAIQGPFIIPYLKKLKFGQSIREEGPSWHIKKTGTPTMGGVMFIISVTISVLLMGVNRYTVALVLGALGFGGIGFIDDFIKVVLKRNLGLTARQKFISQLIVAAIFCAFVYQFGMISGQLSLPFITDTWAMPTMLYLPLLVFVMIGTVNSVNLTDGLDGLATSVTTVVAIFFAIVACKGGESPVGFAATVFSAALVGGCIGFLIFNKHPAKIFMGDTGSLYLGGALSAVAILLDMPLYLIIVGGIFMAETLSVILQVISFKTTGKRIFKMSPLHHHFEMCGWNETKIVWVFTGITALLAIVAYFGKI
ncbi:MAG: phospho-N-acetylmuramoyl-pentapeptide-transferase [Hyphomonadaceae bacterium]|nr:phospho-N-acetylmuramoyl-pentapeptide-transferase [Clostridia bacterium]